MHTLPYQSNADLFPHLASWFRYRSAKYDGFKRMKELWQGATGSNESDYHALTKAEEERWQLLERKAKQENLSGQDAAEYDILLEIKLYHRYRAEYPQMPHESLLAFVKKLL
jgi:hypothetical protein